MATEVSICSNALLMLGDKPIASFDEGTERANLASNLWDDVRDSVLRSHPWNSCIKRVSLAPESTPPAFDWPFSYVVPGDFLKALAVGELGSETEFRLEGGKLLTDVNPCLLRYIFRNDNPATYDPLLVDALTVEMAHRMAYAITQSASMVDQMAAKADRIMRRARSVDGQDDTPETFGDSPLLASRYIGARRNGWVS